MDNVLKPLFTPLYELCCREGHTASPLQILDYFTVLCAAVACARKSGFSAASTSLGSLQENIRSHDEELFALMEGIKERLTGHLLASGAENYVTERLYPELRVLITTDTLPAIGEALLDLYSDPGLHRFWEGPMERSLKPFMECFKRWIRYTGKEHLLLSSEVTFYPAFAHAGALTLNILWHTALSRTLQYFQSTTVKPRFVYVPAPLFEPMEDGTIPVYDAALLFGPFRVSFSPEKACDRLSPGLPGAHRYPDLAAAYLAATKIRGCSVARVFHATLLNDTAALINLRKALVESGRLRAVCEMPRDFAPGIGITEVLLFIGENAPATPESEIKCIDLSALSRKGNPEELGTLLSQQLEKELFEDTGPCVTGVPLKKIAENDYKLLPSFYANQDAERIEKALSEYKTVPLKEVAEIIRCQMVRNDVGEPYREVTGGVCDSLGFIDYDKVEKEVTVDPDKKLLQRQILKDSDLLLITKNLTDKFTVIVKDPPSDLIAGQIFVIIRLKDTAPLTATELFYALRSDLATAYIRLHSTGTLSVLPAKAIENLPVLLPETGLLKDSAERFARLNSLREEMKRLKLESEDLSTLKVL